MKIEDCLELIFLSLPTKIDRDVNGNFTRYHYEELNNEEFKLVVQFENTKIISIGYEGHDREYYPIEYRGSDGQSHEIWNIENLNREILEVAFSQTFGWIEEFI